MDILMLALTLGVMVGVPLACAAAEDKPGEETPAERDARMKWWREARFGMFVHWNVSSVPAGVYHGKHNRFVGEWLMHDEKIPVAEYKTYAKQFNPVKFNADEWVRLVKEAGMKYIVFTAKHHDGFAMYHSKVSDWNIYDATPFKRDPLKELSEACQKHGIKLGFYYSQAADWIHPGGRVPADCWDTAQVGDFDEYLSKIAVPQVREILTGYGPVTILWCDGPWEMTKERADMFLPLLKLQPGILLNDRLGGEYPGDFATPEQGIPEGGMSGRDWETCMTMNDTWGYKSFDNNWKSAETLIRHLADIASKGGNFLLNVGPTAEGLIPEPSVVRLKQVGQWLKVNGEAIYATSAGLSPAPPWGRCTKRVDDKGMTLYLLVFQWPADGKLAVPGLNNPVETAYLLADPDKRALKTASGHAGVTIDVPASAPDKVCSVVVLRVTGGLPRPEPLPADRKVVQQRLNLSRSNVTDAGLANLQKLRDLSRLDLGYCNISDAGLEYLKGLDRLGELNLAGTPITDAGLVHLKGLPALYILILDETKITDAGMVRLKGLTQISDLYLRNTQVTDAGLAHLNPKLSRLYLADTKVTDAGLRHLEGMTHLVTLELCRTAVTDAGLKHLAALTQLRDLDLSGTKITDAGLVHLKGLTQLQGVWLTGTGVTDAGAEDLKKALPNVNLTRRNP